VSTQSGPNWSRVARYRTNAGVGIAEAKAYIEEI
jgi:hypothetical protein